MHLFFRKNIIVLILLLLAVIGAICFLFLNIRNMNENSSVLIEKNVSNQDAENKLLSLKSVLADTQTNIDQVKSYFIAGDSGTVSFIESVEALAKSSNVNLTVGSVSVDTPASGSSSGSGQQVETLHLVLTTKGTWENSQYFITLLEHVPAALSIQQLTLNVVPASTGGSKKGAKDAQWNGSFNISVLELK